MKTSEMIAALEKLGTAYTSSKDMSKPADPIAKLLKLLKARKESTIDDIVVALKTAKLTKPKVGASKGPSAVSLQYLEQLNKPGLKQGDFEKLFAGINTLTKDPVLQIAKRYAPQTGLNSKAKALTAIRKEFFDRAREEDKARQDHRSLLM